MSEQYNGLTAFLEKEYPGHIHTWCYAYVLNLVLCDVTTTNHASYLYWISLKGWSVLSGIILANGHVERADEPRHGHDIQSRLNLIGATTCRWWSKHECL